MKSIQLNMNETKKYLVIKAIDQGKKTKNRACVELNLSERQSNRLLLAYQQKGKEAYFNRKTKVFVIKEVDGDIYLNIADKIYHTKELLVHELYSKNFEPEQKKERRKYIPPQTHPWKLTSFKQYLHKNKKDYEEFTSEELDSPQLQV